MGLDMYLSARKYVQRKDLNTMRDTHEFNSLVSVTDTRDLVESDGYSGATVEIPVAYWRKANWIHYWFVNNVQQGMDDCKDYHVPKEKLVELQAVITEVLANPDKSRIKLPALDGFFFGDTNIYNEDGTLDNYYKETLEYTLERLNKIVNQDNLDVYYTSSW